MISRKSLVAALLSFGILSSIVYVATDVLASMRWEAYRYADWSVSELIAVGSPTRSFVFGPMVAYNVLVLLFGLGVLLSAGAKRSQRVTGALVVAYGVVSWLGLTVFALQPDSPTTGGSMSLSGVLHTGVTVAQVLLMFAFIAVGAAVLGRRFRWYSIVTLAVVLGAGAWAGSYVEQVAAGIHPAGLGLIERASIYSTMLWVAVFAVALVTRQREALPAAEADAAPKKVVVINGSPHKGGQTSTAARKLAANLEALGGVETEVVSLSEYDIRTCKGCKACFSYGEERCPLKDDRDVVFGKMLEADGVVFASPNYAYQVSGVMKVFLDRIAFAMHRPPFHGKSSTAVVVQGIGWGGRLVKYLNFAAGALGFKSVKGSVIRTLEPMTEKALDKMDASLAEQAQRFHDRLFQPAYQAPSVFELMIFRMGRTGIKLNSPRELRDWGYYQEQGWFESDYWYPVRLGVIKKALGAFFDWFVAKTGMFSVAQPAEAERPGTATPASG